MCHPGVISQSDEWPGISSGMYGALSLALDVELTYVAWVDSVEDRHPRVVLAAEGCDESPNTNTLGHVVCGN